ncbi:ParE family toxin-like protein [Ramlibacter sp. Leaf400]|uniref:ParE family toxin-like protein n=1 Tax=Ramlibacter sp. Leaf400 TaxID=1736365 RepID=UPI0007001A47|nr:hypothetical protein [Ramlibacter sp. Leaf400]KQT13184.1 hypothetical protein ASG30_21175 [Ramlibacter sp. Leaf400]
MKHTASARFWDCLEKLPAEIRSLARRNFALLRVDPAHPSLQLKPLGAARVYSVRVGLHYRALGLRVDGGVHWFWIGSHAEYDKLVG